MLRAADMVDAGIHERVDKDRDGADFEADKIPLYRNYAAGKQISPLTELQKQFLEELTRNQFADNVCHPICAEAADRLRFMAWTCEQQAVADELSNLYTTANLGALQGSTHYDALRDGNHALAVNWDAERGIVRIYEEPWWDGNFGLFIAYDALSNPLYGVKEWTELNGERRRLIWFDDGIQRWRGSGRGGTWVPYSLEEDQGRWPVPWMKLDGSPLHIPYVHFPNAGRGSKQYGMSELAGGVIGYQDQLNDLQLSLSAAARVTAYQVYTGTGIPELEKFVVMPGTFLSSTSPDARFGVLPAGDLGQMMGLYGLKLQRVAQMTRTPLHSITGGDWPSGEALLRAEQPAVGKAQSQIERFVTCWTAVGHKAIEIRNRFSTDAALPEDSETALIGAVFAPAERRDPLSQSVIVNNLNERISNQEALRIMGYTEDRAQQVVDEKAAAAEEMSERMLTAFDRGESERGQ